MALCQSANAIQCYHKSSARAFLTLSANPVMRPSSALVPRWVMPEYSVLAALRVQCSSLSSALVLAAAVSAATAQGTTLLHLSTRFVLQPAPGFQTLVSGSPSPSSGCCASGSAICCVLRRYCDSLAQASPRLLSDKGLRLPRQTNSQKTRAQADGLQEFQSEWPTTNLCGRSLMKSKGIRNLGQLCYEVMKCSGLPAQPAAWR